MNKIRLGFAMCGSFCTFSSVIEVMKSLADKYEIYPIMSTNAATTDTRFGTAEEFKKQVEEICGRKIIDSITGAEPIGPKNMLDVLVVAPCTGNTLAKLANSITDTPVTMAVKSHLRGQKPVVIALSTNDGLAGTAKNLGILLNMKNYYFVPFRQDDCERKPFSIASDFSLIDKTVEGALIKKQIQPILL